MANIMTGETKYAYKPIPKDSQVSVVLDSGLSQNTQVSVEVTPDEGYVFDISYFEIITGDNVNANIVLYTKYGNNTLLADSQEAGQDVLYDSSDFRGLSGITKFVVVATATADLTAQTNVVVKYSGRMVRA